MPKIQPITNNFTGGERAPDLDGRVDLQRYNASAIELRNCVVLRKGGITAMPSRDYRGEIKDSAQAARLIEFIYSRTTAYVLEFGNLYMRVWKNGTRVNVEIPTPYTLAQLEAMDFTHGGDTMIITHPDVPTQRLLRFGDASWRMEPAPFKPPALGEVGHRDAAVTMTVSDPTVGTGRTMNASGAVFLAADVGRTISWGSGSFLITAVGSGTSATGNVTAPFQTAVQAGPGWLLGGTPQTTITPSAKDPVGATITLTLGAAGWRSVDVGKFVDVNGGVVEITVFTSSTVVSGIIRTALVDVVAAPADAWVLRGSLWNAVDGYPTSCCFYQQRLWLGGTRRYPQTMWGSRTALFYDFTPGTNDDDAVYKTVDSDDGDAIVFLCSAWSILTLTGSSEFDTRGGIEKPITQLNAQITKRSRYGSERVRPQEVGKDMLAVQAGGNAIRALSNAEGEGFDSRDISLWSEHLFEAGVRGITYQQRPNQMAWIVTVDGHLIPLTYSSEQQVVAFASHDTPGFVEWAVTVPDGARDDTYVLVRYTINGVTRRYIERINWAVYPCQNSRLSLASGSPTAVWTGLDHLEGSTVSLLADDVYVGTATVSGGQVTLPRAASSLRVGLPFSTRAVLQAPEQGTGTGTSQGQAMSTHEVILRLYQTIGSKMNGQYINPREFGVGVLDQAPVPSSGLRSASDFGWERGESDIVLEQDLPYPWTVLAVIRNMTVNQS